MNGNVMDITLGYVLCCQSPALFLAALVLLICYFARRKAHRVRATFDLILAILFAVGGVALYFLGMGWEYFTIRDFLVIRPVGWAGLGIVAVITVVAAIRAFIKVNRRRMEEKAANRAANAESFQRAEEEKAAALAAAEEAKAAEEAARAAAAATAAEVSETVAEVLDEQAMAAAAEASESTSVPAESIAAPAAPVEEAQT